MKGDLGSHHCTELFIINQKRKKSQNFILTLKYIFFLPIPVILDWLAIGADVTAGATGLDLQYRCPAHWASPSLFITDQDILHGETALFAVQSNFIKGSAFVDAAL